jgi:hypothetical protein
MLRQCRCCRGMMDADWSSRAPEDVPLICLGCEQQFLEESTAFRGDETTVSAYHHRVAAAAVTAVMSEIVGHC